MRALSTSLLLAVTMAALALFGAGGWSSAHGHGEGARSTLQSVRHDDATTVSAPRPGPGGTLLASGRKSSRSTPLRLQLGVAILPGAAHLEPLHLRELVSVFATGRPTPSMPCRQNLARAPPV